jgi:hypothetical protein
VAALVRFQFPRDAGRTVVYQKYYLLGLEERARLRVDDAPLPVRLAPRATNKMRVAFRRARDQGEGHVGRYVAHLGDRRVRFAIDAHDSREVRDPDALDWAEVYFKPNRWPDDQHDPKVAPLVNGSGLLDHRRIDSLRRLREVEKSVDVVYLANVWGGREHSLRLFERLAALDCSKDLLAIFPDGFPAEEDERNMERLRARGIPVSRDPLPPGELWPRLARGRVVPLRAGKHLCFSWRTLDLLAMGACVLFDALPAPRWPTPLEARRHVADCGIARPPDTGPAAEAEYAKLPAEVERLLSAPAEQQTLRAAAARYFDQHAAPGPVAGSILERLATA